jgi:hypothetical protein
MVVTRTANLLAAGIAIGFGMAFAGGTFFSQILYGISAHDPLAYFCASAHGSGGIRCVLGTSAGLFI